MTDKERFALYKASMVFALATEEIMKDTFEVNDSIVSLKGLDQEERLIFSELLKARKCYERSIRLMAAYYEKQHTTCLKEAKKDSTADPIEISRTWLRKWDALRNEARSLIRKFFYEEDACKTPEEHTKWEAGLRKLRDRSKGHDISDTFMDRYGKIR